MAEEMMDIQGAMAVIGHVQAALTQHGFPAGEWGPCGLGVDGRYGPDTRAALQAFAQQAGVPYSDPPSDALLGALALEPPVATTELAAAIYSWNHFRENNPNYNEEANVVICEVLGVCGGDRCPEWMLPEPAEPPPGPSPNGGEMMPPPNGGMGTTGKDEGGIPWWVWLILVGGVLGVGGFIGYQAWKDYKGKKKGKRRSKRSTVEAPSYAALKGPEIEDEELGDGDEGGYAGYGNMATDVDESSGEEPEADEEGG